MTVVARWEWRIFGDGFGAAERRLAQAAPDRVEDSEELYIVSVASDASVKVRDGRLDGKRLLRVDRDGIEQWTPVVKAAFPLAAADLEAVLTLLGVAGPRGAEGAESVDALVALVEDEPELMAVPVAKHREHFTFAGCMAERSVLRTPGGAIGTLAVESPDLERLKAAVGALGLADRAVVSVPRALKAMIGFGAPRAAVIDVGTNSVKFHVGQRASEGHWEMVVDRAEVTRLGEGLADAGALTPPAIDRTVEAIVAMADEARRLGAPRIAAVGTAGLRMAPNAAVLVDAVRDRTGVTVQVLSGEDEARLAFTAAVQGLDLPGAFAVFDTGGGSTQFTFGHGTQVDEQFSLKLGAVALTERFGLAGAVSNGALHRALTAIEHELSALREHGRPESLVGMGGAVTNLAAVSRGLRVYDPDVVHGTVLGRAEIERQIELYRTRSADGRREIVGLQPARAEVILAGACVVRTVLALLDMPALVVSDRGLRHGVIAERFGRAAPSHVVVAR